MNDEIFDYSLYIDQYIVDTLQEIIINCVQDDTIYFEFNEQISDKDPAVTLQYYFDDKFNKCFLQFRFNKIFNRTYNDQLVRIIERFQNSIKNNFKSDTQTWPELTLISYKRRKLCDSSPVVTPFTIGYWKSLSGQYEFLVDQVKVLQDYTAMAAPTQSAAYNAKVKEIYDMYYETNFNKFVEEMYKASLTYKIKYDQPPKKNFADFIRMVEDLNNLYHQIILSETDKQDFINDYMNLIAHHWDDPNYRNLLENLYNTYGVKEELQKKVPEIFDLYKAMYASFMEKELEIIDVDYDHNDDKTEIWYYDGDFDFGDLSEGTDPDSVAREDYDYNKAAYRNLILTKNYDILSRKVTE